MSPSVSRKRVAGIEVQCACAGVEVPALEQIRDWAAAALAGCREGLELTVRVVDEPEGARLNETYRHRRGATNVLSFPFEAPADDVPWSLLGDVVVCAPVVAREAAEQGVDPEAHWAHVVVHGVLHLLGYDHERVEEARIMESLEVMILARLGLSDPYRIQPSVDT